MHPAFLDFKQYNIPDQSIRPITLTNEIQVLIVVNESDYEAFTDLLNNITKVLPAELIEAKEILKLKVGEQINLGSLKSSSVKRVVAFGTNPASLGLNAAFKAYYFYNTENFSILFSHSLEKLNAKKEYKKALWTSLQKEFELKK